MTRAAISISSNIAEGCSRSSEKDYARFLEISLGSAFELETNFVIAIQAKLVDPSEGDTILSEIYVEQKMINALLVKIIGNRQKPPRLTAKS